MEFVKDSYTINEISDMVDINTSTLRNWEKEFNLKVPRNNRNHRYYTEKEIEVFKIIKDGREKNHSIETIKKALEKHGIIEEQQEHGTGLMTLDQLTVEEFQERMFSNFKDVVAETIIERENELKKEFERKLQEREDYLTEKIAEKVKEQMESENDKLMKYLDESRNESKKGFWSKIFKKS